MTFIGGYIFFSAPPLPFMVSAMCYIPLQTTEFQLSYAALIVEIH